MLRRVDQASPARRRVARPDGTSRELPSLQAADEVVLCAGAQNGTPAILVAARQRLFLVSLPHGEVQVATYPIRRVMLVEEHRSRTTSDVVVLTTNATIAISKVAVGAAWAFCRRVRQEILAGAGAREQRAQARRKQNSSSRQTGRAAAHW